MKLLAAVALATATLSAGCLNCGWDGAGNTMLRSATTGDAVLVCANGGFSAMLSDGSFIEGWATENWDANGVRTYSFVDGESNQTIDLGTLEESTMNQFERDHTDVLCQDLETRAWWTVAQ